MALLDDVLKWSVSDLKLWQRDAARRLLQRPEGLSEQDFAELYGMLKSAHGLSGSVGIVPVPLAAEHLPSGSPETATVVLKTMRDLVDVNRIAPDQKLDFCAPTGMTVIYGGNASGKSGYARVLKRACRARDQSEAIHPDATDATTRNRIPEATFDIEVGGASRTVKWTASTTPPSELSGVAVFDCHCARAYLSEGEPAYLPYGLDIVESLANEVLPEMSRRLDAELAGISVDRLPFDHLLGDTQVGHMVASLSGTTDETLVRALAAISDTERQRLAELETALGEADPKAKAQELRLSAGRLKALAGRVENAQAWVSEAAVNKLRQLDDVAVAAVRAEKLAADTLRLGENLLPGTGEQLWKDLFNAARKFSVEAAYPGLEFPHTDDGALCPLCQQPVAAGERLRRFEKYIKDDVSRNAELRRKDAETARTKIEGASLSVGLDVALRDELVLLDSGMVQALGVFETALAHRRTWMLQALVSHVWDNVPALGVSPGRLLRDLAARQLKSTRTFLRASRQEENKRLKAERDELRARRSLSVSLDALLALVGRMKKKAALQACKADLDTRPISYKSREFASSAVTTDLRSALDKEFEALNVEHVKVLIKPRTEKGKTLYRLALALPQAYNPEEILSEGEQRAIAIGSFLAELKAAKHGGPIIFDDPVSSLDHWRRRKVAFRLVEEAKSRQVVALTHDTVFLGELTHALSGMPHTLHNMEWRNGRPGHVGKGLPWEHRKHTECIDALEKAQKEFEKKPWPAYPNQDESAQMRQQYARLRATVERVIENVVFSGVVRRFRDYVDVKQLQDVVGFTSPECDEVLRLYHRCCDVVDAHDHAPAKNAPVPTAAEFGKDIDALKAVVTSIKDRRKRSQPSPAAALPTG